MRLIDADKIVAYLHEQLEFAKLNNDRCLKVAFKHAILKLDNAPTLDAVPVVRCKECIDRGACIFEDYFSMSGIEDSYCCMGKRMGAKEGLRCHAEEQ